MAAGPRIEPPVSEPSVAGISRAATAAAPPLVEPPVIRRGPRGCAGGRCGVVAGDAERELDHVEPADIDRTGGVQPGDHRGRDRPAGAPRIKAGAAFGELARTVEHVLVRQRHAVQGPERSAVAPAPRRPRRRRPAPPRARAAPPRSSARPRSVQRLQHRRSSPRGC